MSDVVVALSLSLMVLFIHATTWKGNLMSWVKKVIKPTWYISKPIYGCPVCMTPYWGALVYRILFYDGSQGWEEWVFVLMTASGWSVVVIMAIYVKDYCKSRTRKEEECC